MAKRAAILLLAALLIPAFTPPAQAQDPYEKYGGPPPGKPAPGPPPAPARVVYPPPPRYPHAGPYFAGNIGIFEPNDYFEGLQGYDSDLAANLVIGSRVNPFVGVEAGVGYFAADVGSNEVSVVPVTFGLRLIVPHPVFEPYFGMGLGFYFAELDEPPFTPPFNYIGTNDSDTTIGGYFSLGLDLWLTPKAALNLEGRYQIAEPSFTTNAGVPFDLDVSGWTLTMGARLSF